MACRKQTPPALNRGAAVALVAAHFDHAAIYAAGLYYHDELTQQEIEAQTGVPQWKLSRTLAAMNKLLRAHGLPAMVRRSRPRPADPEDPTGPRRKRWVRQLSDALYARL